MLRGYFCEDCGKDGFIKSGPKPKVCSACESKNIIGVKFSKAWLQRNLGGIRHAGLQVVCNLQMLFPGE